MPDPNVGTDPDTDWRSDIEEALLIFNEALYDACPPDERTTAPDRIARILHGDDPADPGSTHGGSARPSAEAQSVTVRLRLRRVVACEIAFKASVALGEEQRRRREEWDPYVQPFLERVLHDLHGIVSPDAVAARRGALELADGVVLEQAKAESGEPFLWDWDELRPMYAAALQYLRDYQLATLSRLDEDETELEQWRTNVTCKGELEGLQCLHAYRMAAMPTDHEYADGVLEIDIGVGTGAAAAALIDAVPSLRPTPDSRAQRQPVPTASQLVGIAMARAAQACYRLTYRPLDERERVQASIDAAAMTTMKLLQEALQARLGMPVAGVAAERRFLQRAVMVVDASLGRAR